MKDNLSIIITMLIFVILIVIFPLYNYFERQDDMSYNLVLKATTNFVDEVINCGYIDQEMYDNYINNLANTGNSYDVQIEAHKRVYTRDPEMIANGVAIEDIPYIEQYEVDYNKDIFDENTGKTITNDIGSVDKKVLQNGAYYLNVGDQIYVKLKNISTTMAGAIFNLIVPTSSTERVTVNYGGIIKNNAWEETDKSAISQGDIYVSIVPVGTTVVEIGKTDKLSFNISVNNYDTSLTNSQITDAIKANISLKEIEGNKIISNAQVTKQEGTNNTWIATFDIEEGNEGQYNAVLAANAIQGKIYKNGEVQSNIITIKPST